MAVAGGDRVGASEVEFCVWYLEPVLRTLTDTAEVRGVPVVVGLQKHASHITLSQVATSQVALTST
jgi:hypothetical protein